MNARETVLSLAKRPASKSFQPTPYKLAQVISSRGDEYTSNDLPKPYNNQVFDPWRRGDLVVVEHITRSYYLKGPATVSSTWHVGRRHTTPGAKRQLIAFNEHGRIEPGRDAKLYRIVLRYLSRAEKLVGQEFATRDELEAALENPASVELLQAAE